VGAMITYLKMYINREEINQQGFRGLYTLKSRSKCSIRKVKERLISAIRVGNGIM